MSTASGRHVNLYIAYYNSQRKGEAVHSPRSCLPGGGWQMRDFGQRELPAIVVGGQPLRVNRTLIELGDQRQLVYYWFQQRGRVITNEFAVKWYLFWDAITRHRTDGALVRSSTPLPRGKRGGRRSPHHRPRRAHRARAVPPTFRIERHAYVLPFVLAMVVTMAWSAVAGEVWRPNGESSISRARARSITVPIPRVGGIAMAIGVLVAAFIAIDLRRRTAGSWLAAGVLVVFGAADDRFDLDYRIKFVGQLLAVGIVVFAGDVQIRASRSTTGSCCRHGSRCR